MKDDDLEEKVAIFPSENLTRGNAPLHQSGLLRLSQIIGPKGLIPVSRSTFLNGVRKGIYPKAGKLGRLKVWRADVIRAFIEEVAPGK